MNSMRLFKRGGGYAVALLVISETACHLVGQEKMSLSHFSSNESVLVSSALIFAILNFEFTEDQLLL